MKNTINSKIFCVFLLQIVKIYYIIVDIYIYKGAIRVDIENTIKIMMENDEDSITAKLIKIENK